MKTELRKYLNSGDCYQLAGPRYSKQRQAVMQIITGVKLPVARCGVNNLARGLADVSGVSGDCLAVRERNITEWLQS